MKKWAPGFIFDLPRVLFGRAILSQCSSIVFFLVMSKDVIVAFWHFGIRYSDFTLVLSFKLFHPEGTLEWSPLARKLIWFLHVLVRVLDDIPRVVTISWVIDVSFKRVAQVGRGKIVTKMLLRQHHGTTVYR